ncbi:MAG: hypothetical protein G01um101449_437 [Parcubacteria group bacterium Gr01-1014_49]|nr:MAG: hypothetical protein G01um101449_437 [Parcubacteria group bacterium Gr01-1014_49]
MQRLSSGCLSVELFDENGRNALVFRVSGENDSTGVEEALSAIGKIETAMKAKKIRYEAMERKYGDGKVTDAILIRLFAERKGQRRNQDRRQKSPVR